MAPLPSNNTGVLFVDYTSAGFVHTMQFRKPDATDLSAFVTVVRGACDSLSTMMNANDSFFAATFRAKDEDFSLPVDWAELPGSDENAAWAEDPESVMLSFCGRSAGGRRARFEFFTIKKLSDPWPLTNRYEADEEVETDAIMDVYRALVAGTGARAVAIDGLSIVPYNYLNISKNAYWQRKQRTS